MLCHQLCQQAVMRRAHKLSLAELDMLEVSQHLHPFLSHAELLSPSTLDPQPASFAMPEAAGSCTLDGQTQTP